MEFKLKINQVRESLENRWTKTKEVDFSDINKFHKKTLKRLPDISHLKSLVLFSGIASLLIFILFAQSFSSLYEHLPMKPVFGGTYKEGMVGEIKQLNPLYSPVNYVEDSVVSLIFSGLTKNISNRQVVGDLAESWVISGDKKTYTFTIRENIFWHDGERLDADDVRFTFEAIQNPDSNSPRLATWKDVVVSVLDERTVAFKLPSPYASFLSLADVPILPEHILREVPVGNFRTSEFSTNPVGSGPYIFSKIKNIRDMQEVHLLANRNYFLGSPYIEEVVLKSYPNYGSLVSAYNRKEIAGMGRVQPSSLNRDDQLPNIKLNNLIVPEYDVLYYNLVRGATTDKALREAISLSIDKMRIVEVVYQGEAIPIHSAILPGYLGYNETLRQPFDLVLAKEKLKDANYTLDGRGDLMKDGERVSVRLVVVDEGIKVRLANLLAEMIGELGIKVEVEIYPLKTYIEEMVRPRNFDLIIATQNLGSGSDIYTFYHANMATDPGLNLSGIKNRQIDKYLEIARTSHDKKIKEARYREISKLINNNVPATYLIWPGYLYGVSDKVKRENSIRISNPKDRFWNIKDWYIKEERDY